MKKIYIILMDTKTIPSKLVKIFTRYNYSHVAISFDENCNTLYSFGRRKLNRVFDGGFIIEHKNGEFFKKFNQTKCIIYEVKISNDKYIELKKIIKNMKENKDIYKYDFLGIVLRYFNIPITFKNKYVCSYFVASLLDEMDIYNFNKRPCFVKPKDFTLVDIFNKIYCGNYVK